MPSSQRKKIKYHNDIEQTSQEWHELRNGRLTGTDAALLLAGKSIKYILNKKTTSTFKGSRSTRRGHKLEPEAVWMLEQIKGVKVHHSGFVTNNNYPIVGYSPDGLIGDDGIVECKAFNRDRHLANAAKIELSIVAQMQWGMFVSGRKWGYLVLYNPDLSPEEAVFIRKVNRNPKTIKRFKELIANG